MSASLSQRVALVTGGSKGIGKATAAALADEGARVAICSRGLEALELAESEIRAAGGAVIGVQADATDSDSVNAAVAKVVDVFGGLDILVNNVGGAVVFADFFDLTHDDWRKAFELNVMSMVSFVKAALPWLRQSQAARIITISSMSGIEPGSYNPHYTLTKAATINLSKYLSHKLASERILVNVVCPGPVRSTAWDAFTQHLAEQRGCSLDTARDELERNETAKIPLRRLGIGEDVAHLVAFLATDKAAWITGSCVHVNGGKLRSMC